MSSRDILLNKEVFVPGSTITKWGMYFRLTSSGGNQQTGQPLAPHPYTLLKTDRFNALYMWEWNQTYYPGRIPEYGSVECTITWPRQWNSADDAALYAKLERRYDKGDFNAAIFGGELGKSVDMLADRTKQLAKALFAAKRGRFAQAAYILGVGGNRKVSSTTKHRHRDDAGFQDPQRISNGWLELQYGWKPLIEDVFRLADQIAKSDEPKKKRITASHGIEPGTASCTQNTNFTVSGGGKISKRIVAYIEEDRPSWPQALGLMDPELVAWEVLPFSFVIDWFLPIGSWLQARAFASRAKGTFVITTRTKYKVHLGSVKWPPGKLYKTLTLQSYGYKSYVSLTRTVHASLPQLPLPTFQNGIGEGYRLQNAVALLVGIFSGRK